MNDWFVGSKGRDGEDPTINRDQAYGISKIHNLIHPQPSQTEPLVSEERKKKSWNHIPKKRFPLVLPTKTLSYSCLKWNWQCNKKTLRNINEMQKYNFRLLTSTKDWMRNYPLFMALVKLEKWVMLIPPSRGVARSNILHTEPIFDKEWVNHVPPFMA